MVESFTELSIVKSEMECCKMSKTNCCTKQEQIRHLSVSMGIKRIISELITEWLVVGVGFVYNQVCMRVWGEDIFVTVIGENSMVNK